MPRSERLSWNIIRQIFDLVEELSDLGDNPDVWRPHALNRLCQLVGATVGISADLINGHPGTIPRLIDPLDCGWRDQAIRRTYYGYYAAGQITADPGADRLLELHQTTRFLTWRRSQYIDDADWYAAPSVSEARRSGDIDDFCSSTVALRPGVLQGFVLYRPCGDPPFELRDQRAMRLFHLQLLRRIKKEDALAGPHLSPRLRQALDLLLMGESLKGVAARMGISYHTANDYQKSIYRQFDVSTRAELLIHCLPRRRYVRLPRGLLASI